MWKVFRIIRLRGVIMGHFLLVRLLICLSVGLCKVGPCLSISL